MELDKIKLNPNNPRFIKDEKFKSLVKSLIELPVMTTLREIVVDEDNVIIGGNMRYRAAKEAGWKEIPTKVFTRAMADENNKLTNQNKTYEQYCKEIMVKDNISGGEWDWELLSSQFEKEELEDWGLDIDKNWKEDDIIEDEVPEVTENPISKLGEVYQLGRHRLMCGDSTDKATVEKLMNGNKADIAFSSPPYNAGTTATETAMGKTTKYNGNDDNKTEADYIAFLNSYIECAIEHCEYVFMNVQSISNNKIALIDVLYHNKDIYADTIIWDKIHGQPAMAENVMNSVFEYVHIFSKKANRAIGTIRFRGTVDNILHLQSQRKNEYSDIHNATFSVELASHFIRNFAKESVLDQFGGTGTTLIACEQTNRICYGMEIDPKYCDVIRKRYAKFINSEDWESATPKIL